MKKLLGIGDVSRLTNVPIHKIQYAISNGSVPEPKMRISNKRAFSEKEVGMIANYFSVQIEENCDVRKRDE